MPLLRKEPFVRNIPPPGLKPNDDVYFCKLTGEIFDDYDKFFERIILCNSLVWTCSYTGRFGLTYQEAVHSEKRAQEQLDNFPEYLQIPLLYLASLTHRSRLNDVIDDVFMFSKDRYFIGESIFLFRSGERKPCKVIQIIPPGDGKLVEKNGKADESGSDSDVICLDDDEIQPPKHKKIKLSESAPVEKEDKSTAFGPSPELYQYVIQEPKLSNSNTVPAKNLSRKKGLFTRDKCKLFLKQHCNPDDSGIWKVKSRYVDKFRLSHQIWSSFFSGPTPSYKISESKKRPSSSGRQTTLSGNEALLKSRIEDSSKSRVIDLTEDDDFVSTMKKSKEKPKKTQTESVNIDEEFKKMRREMEERAKKREQERLNKIKAIQDKKDAIKKTADERRQKLKEEKEKEKMEKKQRDDLLRELNKPRDDLECEDLKDLPAATPVSCSIPDEIFGDAILVLEYLFTFQSIFELNLPSNISFDALGKALNESEVDGLFADIIRELLSAIFRLQEEELCEETENEKDWKGLPEGLDEHEDTSVKDLIKAATAASQWSMISYGTSLRKLQVDGYTLTEIVRLHLLSSGSLSGINSKFDYQRRGGYSPHDDPGLIFRRQETAILRALADKNLFDLTSCEKLKIISVLIHQLLTFAVSRDVIDENVEELKQVQKVLRQHQWAEQKREKDESHYRWRKRMGLEPDSKLEEEKDEEEKKKKLSLEPTDEDFENMPTENLDWGKISLEKRSQMKEWYVRREKELMQQSIQLQYSHSVVPIGRDRTFRRFWVFCSVPGLFVEDDSSNEVTEDYLKCVGHHALMNKEASTDGKNGNDDTVSEGEKSDKENVPVGASDSNNIDTDHISISENAVMDRTNMRFVSVLDQINSWGKVRWSFFSTPEEIDCLIDSLNPRGFREGALRSTLIEQKDRLKDDLIKYKDQNVNDAVKTDVQEKRGGARSRGKQAANVIKFSSAQECLESNLRDMLLDLEERIDAGSLGLLKINRRVQWRRALEEGHYDPQTKSLFVAGRFHDLSNGFIQINPIQKDIDVIDLDAYHEVVLPVVRDLTKALLQIEQMVDQRYFCAPLASDPGKKGKQKVNHDGRTIKEKKKDECSLDSDDESSSSGPAQQKTALERWEESLISCTSLPQIFLHLSVLESSILWSKSALHARCRICRRKGDGERMLLCDACDKGHHMYCLKPPVKHVPDGDWFCPSCRPKDVVHMRTPRKIKSFDEISEDDNSTVTENQNDDDRESDEENQQIDDDDESSKLERSEEEDDDDNEEEEEEDIYYDEEDQEVQLAPTKIKFTKGIKSKANNQHPETSDVTSRSITRMRSAAVAMDTITRSRDGSQERRASKRKSETVNDNVELHETRGPRNRKSVEVETNIREKRTRVSLESGIISKRSTSEINLSDTLKSLTKEHVTVNKICEDLVNELMDRDEAWPFLKPVKRREAPDYFDIIQRPMDFSCIHAKINSGNYIQPSDIVDDVRQIFANYKQYNMPTAPVFSAGQKLERYFEKRLRELKLNSLLSNLNNSGTTLNGTSPKKALSKTRGKRTI